MTPEGKSVKIFEDFCRHGEFWPWSRVLACMPLRNPDPASTKRSGQIVLQPSKATQLSVQEAERLKSCEQTIRRGLRTFVEVGLALQEIRDSRLYRITHSGFEAYVRDVLDLSRAYAHEIIESAKVVHALSSIEDMLLPTNEAQVRALRRWSGPEERAGKWKQVLSAAGQGPITAKLVRETLQPAPVESNCKSENEREKDTATAVATPPIGQSGGTASSPAVSLGLHTMVADTEDPPLFTFVDGRTFRASEWPEGRISADKIARVLREEGNRNREVSSRRLSDDELLQMQNDMIAFGELASRVRDPQGDDGSGSVAEEATPSVNCFFHRRA